MESALVILEVGLLFLVQHLLLRSVGGVRHDSQVRRQSCSDEEHAEAGSDEEHAEAGSGEEHAEAGLSGDGVQGESSESAMADLSGVL